jgi:hypothetical protein
MGEFLLTLKEQSGGNDFITNHIIEAEDRQMVKYHYHRTLKDGGWADTDQYRDKHALYGPKQMVTELRNIRELSDVESYALKKHLHTWTKI